RNLRRRVEVIWPVEQPDLKRRLIDEILATCLADNVKSRQQLADGSYQRIETGAEQARLRSQERFLELAATNAARRFSPEPTPTVEARPIRRPRRRRKQAG